MSTSTTMLLYHATPAANAGAIVERGLLARPPARHFGCEGLYLATTPDQAHGWARVIADRRGDGPTKFALVQVELDLSYAPIVVEGSTVRGLRQVKLRRDVPADRVAVLGTFTAGSRAKRLHAS